MEGAWSRLAEGAANIEGDRGGEEGCGEGVRPGSVNFVKCMIILRKKVKLGGNAGKRYQGKAHLVCVPSRQPDRSCIPQLNVKSPVTIALVDSCLASNTLCTVRADLEDVWTDLVLYPSVDLWVRAHLATRGFQVLANRLVCAGNAKRERIAFGRLVAELERKGRVGRGHLRAQLSPMVYRLRRLMQEWTALLTGSMLV